MVVLQIKMALKNIEHLFFSYLFKLNILIFLHFYSVYISVFSLSEVLEGLIL